MNVMDLEGLGLQLENGWLSGKGIIVVAVKMIAKCV